MRFLKNLSLLDGLYEFWWFAPTAWGDVILSTPVFAVIKRYYPEAELTLLVRQEVVPILKGLSSIDHIQVYDPERAHAGFKGFLKLYQEIRKAQFDVAVVLKSQWEIAWVLLLARIPYRVGPLSKLHSFFIYNRGVRQRRSHVEMHETDYNLQLLRKLGVRVDSRNVKTEVYLSPESREDARKWLVQQGWNEKEPLVMVHPGMGGSALNWPEPHYQDLIQALAKLGHRVVVTGGPTESGLLDRLFLSLNSHAEQVFFYKSPLGAKIDFLAGLFSWASLVIASSTGPLHLAVALERRVLTFFSPIRVQSAVRWGPYLPDESRASILVPDVYCGQDFKCLGNLCNYFPCMKSLTLKQVLAQVNLQLKLQSGDLQHGKPSDKIRSS